MPDSRFGGQGVMPPSEASFVLRRRASAIPMQPNGPWSGPSSLASGTGDRSQPPALREPGKSSSPRGAASKGKADKPPRGDIAVAESARPQGAPGSPQADARIGVISDNHGHLDPAVLEVFAGVTHIIHAGDIMDPEILDALRKVAPVTAVAGNMDREGVRQWLDEKAINIHGRGTTIGQVGFMGLGGGTPSPFGTPWEIADSEAAGVLASGLAAISACPYKVLVSHAPPRGTKIDRSFAGMHLGSGAVRDFLLAGSVDLCICGHIHESPGEDTLGRARCLNVGPFKNGRYALIAII